IGEECAKSGSYVVAATYVIKQRLRAEGCTLIAVYVVEQRSIASRGVLVTCGVVKQCLETETHVLDSNSDVIESILADRSALPISDDGRIWTPCFERWRERKPAECDCCNKKAATHVRAADGS